MSLDNFVLGEYMDDKGTKNITIFGRLNKIKKIRKFFNIYSPNFVALRV